MTYAGHHPNQCFCWGSTKLAQLSGGPFKAIKPTEDLARKENSRCKLSRQGGEEIFFFIFIYFPQFENIASGTIDVVIFNFLLGAYFYYTKIHPLPKPPQADFHALPWNTVNRARQSANVFLTFQTQRLDL